MSASKNHDVQRIQRRIIKYELENVFIYNSLLRREYHKDLHKLLSKLSGKESEHLDRWAKIEQKRYIVGRAGPRLKAKAFLYSLARTLLGHVFLIKLLEMREKKLINRYAVAEAISPHRSQVRRIVSGIMADEGRHKSALIRELEEYGGGLDYTKSIIFGLNDGLVEVLGAVVGFAAITTNPTIVILGGVIVAIAGTLSMAGGSYVSASSQRKVSRAIPDGSHELHTVPLSEAYFTGVFYFGGAMVPIVPFVLGLSGYVGMLASILMATLVLFATSVIVGILSDTSIRHGATENILISLGAAFSTILVGTFARVYLHIVI